MSEVRRALEWLDISYRDFAVMCGIGMALAVFEGLAVGSIFPVLLYLDKGAAAFASDPVGAEIAGALEAVDLPVSLGTLLLLAMVPVIGRQALLYFNTVYATHLTNRTAARLQTLIASALMRADLAFHYRRNKADLQGYVVNNTYTASNLARSAVMVATHALALAVYFAILLYLFAKLALISVCIMLPVLFFFRRQNRQSLQLGQTQTTVGRRISERVIEYLQNIRHIKMRGAENTAANDIATLVNEYSTVATRITANQAMIEASATPVLMLAAVTVIYFGVEWLGLGLAVLGTFVMVMMRMTPQLTALARQRAEILARIRALQAVQDVVTEAQAETRAAGGTRVFRHLSEGLVFDHVSFDYVGMDKTVPALRDVSFRIDRGKVTALVGRSGAGKSTAIDMIPRLIEPTDGCILADGTPISEYDVGSLRRRIAFVAQDSVLFDDTIRANLIYGVEPQPSDAQLRDALRQAHCLDFVDAMPRGIDTSVGDRGISVSGGQRQRLAIARALASEPEILILDEPTSALDSESEAAIQAALAELRGKMTIVIIAHRLATIRQADRIVVMDQGRVVAQGDHRSLNDTDNTYRQLFQMQMQV